MASIQSCEVTEVRNSSEVRHGRALSTVLAFLVLSGIALALQFFGGAFAGERTTFSDETAHYLNSIVIRDYIAKGFPEHPMEFASRYYASYPKVALMVWPPGFHGALGLFLLAVGTGAAKALVFVALCSSGAAFLLYICLRKHGWTIAESLWPAILMLLLPSFQELNLGVMLDTALALVGFGFAWQLARFMDSPTMRNAVFLGLLGASACLIKGNGVAFCAAAPLAMLLRGRLRLLIRKEIYVTGLITLSLSAIPLAIAVQWLRSNRIEQQLSVASLIVSVKFYAHAMDVVLKFIPLVAVSVALVATLLRYRGGAWISGPEKSVYASMFACAASFLIVHSLLAHPYPDERYVLPTVACLFYFLPQAGAWLGSVVGRPLGARTAFAAAVIVLFLVVDFKFVRIVPGGFREAVSILRREGNGTPLRVLVLSGDRGEGSFITEVADTDPQRRDVVVRAGKLVMLANWHATEKTYLFPDAASLARKIERAGIRFMVVDRTVGIEPLVDKLVFEVVGSGADRFQPVATLPVTANRTHHLEIFRVVHATDPPAERVELSFPFSSGIMRGRKILQ